MGVAFGQIDQIQILSANSLIWMRACWPRQFLESARLDVRVTYSAIESGADLHDGSPAGESCPNASMFDHLCRR